MKNADLPEVARIARISALKMTHRAKASHIGSSLSVIDIAVQLFSQIDETRIGDKNQNIVLVSKGHAAAGIYAVLAALGLISQNDIEQYCDDGAKLGGHVTSTNVPVLDFSTGSLGHALPFAVGRALAKKKKQQGGNVYVILSDGECDEGSNWEAALLANHLNLNNLVVVIDRNRLQSLKGTEETVKLEPLKDKWRAFGWNTHEINGHNFRDLAIIVQESNSTSPRIYIAETQTGHGVTFMKDEIDWHYKSTSDDELKIALEELSN
jgi:transketolase